MIHHIKIKMLALKLQAVGNQCRAIAEDLFIQITSHDMKGWVRCCKHMVLLNDHRDANHELAQELPQTWHRKHILEDFHGGILNQPIHACCVNTQEFAPSPCQPACWRQQIQSSEVHCAIGRESKLDSSTITLTGPGPQAFP